MNISEAIRQLQALQSAHGDLRLMTPNDEYADALEDLGYVIAGVIVENDVEFGCAAPEDIGKTVAVFCQR